jgi:hypothetical protein
MTDLQGIGSAVRAVTTRPFYLTDAILEKLARGIRPDSSSVKGVDRLRQVETPQGLGQFGIARCEVTPPVGFYHRR